jgi:hypothetical protein
MRKRKSNLILFPLSSDVCQECGWPHESIYPHFLASNYYQMKFYDENDRAPTWEDALAHCPESMKEGWRASMARTRRESEKLGLANPV